MPEFKWEYIATAPSRTADVITLDNRTEGLGVAKCEKTGEPLFFVWFTKHPNGKSGWYAPVLWAPLIKGPSAAEISAARTMLLMSGGA